MGLELHLAVAAGVGRPAPVAPVSASGAQHHFGHRGKLALAVLRGGDQQIKCLRIGQLKSGISTPVFVVLAIPFRRRHRWAWWAAWVPMIANLATR